MSQMRGTFKEFGLAEGNIFQATEKSDITEHYGNPTMPMQLRMLREEIYGRGFM